jgi:hypothetical protein
VCNDEDFFNDKDTKFAQNKYLLLCHPAGIFAVVGTAISSTYKDPYPNGIPFRDRMTYNHLLLSDAFPGFFFG